MVGQVCRYGNQRRLLLGKSAYSWIDEDGVETPRSSHFVPTLALTWRAIVVFLAAALVPVWATPINIYVSRCCEVDEIDRVSPGGSVTTFATSGLNEALGLAFDATGGFFVANYGNSTVEKFTRNGVGSVFASTGVNGPTGLAFDAQGNLFVANGGNNTIEKFALNGVGTIFASTGLNDPGGLAFDAQGNLFVANGGNNTIEKFTPSGIASVFASSVFSDPLVNDPLALAFDASGNLFVGDFISTIVGLTPSGEKFPFATVPAEVEGLAFDNAGNLLVADGGGGSVLAFAPNGDQQTIASDLPIATGLAVEPAASSVPEPSMDLVFTIAIASLCLTRQRIIGNILSGRIRRSTPPVTPDLASADDEQPREGEQHGAI